MLQPSPLCIYVGGFSWDVRVLLSRSVIALHQYFRMRVPFNLSAENEKEGGVGDTT